MGFASQPPLSALGGSGSGAFIPSPSSSGARCEDKPSQTPAALQGLPTPHASSTASYPTPLEPPHTNPMNARMFNPVATSGAGLQSFQTPTNAISAQVVGPLSASVSSTLVQGSSETPVGPSVSTKSSSTSTSLRGRERYCSGGAWVGPAPTSTRECIAEEISRGDTKCTCKSNEGVRGYLEQNRRFVCLLE